MKISRPSLIPLLPLPLLLLLALLVAATTFAASPPPIPAAAPVLLVGHPDLSGAQLAGNRALLAMGRAGKDGPLALGEQITAGALQENVLERVQSNGRQVLRRSSKVRRPGSEDVLMQASIEMDPETLLPLHAETVQGGNRTVLEYDWDKFTVRRSPGSDGAEFDEDSLDLPMLEVGAHDVWMAALPLREGFVARLPAYFGATGTKYWAVPKVVGSEAVDLGDGVSRQAWVVELDWWGMGAHNTSDNYAPGGGANGTGGTGGKYWVLKEQADGLPRVVRVRTEVDAESDSVIQLQSHSK